MSHQLNRRPFKELLRYAPGANRGTIRRYYRLWREAHGLAERCDMQECQFHRSVPVWNGKLLPLIVDHINGVNADNRPRNLRLLCPNCNQQLPTHAGGNKGRVKMAAGGYAQREADKWHYTMPTETAEFVTAYSPVTLHLQTAPKTDRTLS